MANQKNKKTKEDFTSLILGIDPESAAEAEVMDTRVLSEEKDPDTLRIVSPKNENVFTKVANEKTEATVENKVEVKRAGEIKYDPSLVSVEAALKQAELLRLSQNKILELEKTNQELIQENETLSASSLVLQKKNDQMASRLEDLKAELASKNESVKEEVQEKEKSYNELKKDFDKLEKKYQEVQALTSEKFQASRRREKELLNRLEILQQEGDVVLTNKDERLLNLKKEIDKHQFEVESLRAQLLDQQNKMKTFKEQVKRSLKALKLASSLLEDEEDQEDLLRKTGS